MDKETQFHATVNLIYEAVVDDTLWPNALMSLADVIGTTHIGLYAMDRRAKIYDSILPRTDPEWVARYKQHWAFYNPLLTLSTTRPASEIFFLDDLMPREQFVTTPFYKEWFYPAGIGLGLMGANLYVGDESSALIVAANARGQDHITIEQARIFKAALRHINRAVQIHCMFRICDLDHDTTPERLEHMASGVMLVDRTAKVLFANKWARAMLGNGSGLTVHAGRLHSTNGSDKLQRLIASCARNFLPPNCPGGEISLRRSKHRPIRVTVTPLRARGNVAELPWLGLQLPVAMVTVSNPSLEKWRN